MSGRITRRLPLPQNVGKMASPVRCRRCGHIYDLIVVTVVHRHADCTVWNCPGCGVRVDDRGESGLTDHKNYDRIERVNAGLDVYGNPIDGDF